MQDSLRIGTRGWRYQAWDGTFYDADLPPEWQLSWYANHLRSVLIPADGFHQMSPARVRCWVDDTDPEFRFIATIDPVQFPPDCREPMLPDLEALVVAFGEQLDVLLSGGEHRGGIFRHGLQLFVVSLPGFVERLGHRLEQAHGGGEVARRRAELTLLGQCLLE